MSVIWKKVWFDLWHNKLRTLLVVISIAVGVFAVGVTFGMVDQLLPTMDSSHASTNPSVATLNPEGPVDEATIKALTHVPGVQYAEGMNQLEIRYKLNPGDEWQKGVVLQRDFAHQFYDVLQLREGEWPKGRSLGIERMHSPWYKIFIGTNVIMEVNGKEHSFPVTGIVRHPFVPPPSMYDLTFFFADDEMMEMMGIPIGSYTGIKIGVTPYSREYSRQVTSDVKERLAAQGINIYATVYQDPAKHWGRMFMDGMSLVLKVLAVMSMFLSVVLVMNTLTALITQQTNQIGILKAIGGSSYTISKVYLAGVLVYGILSLCIALPLGAFVAFQTTKSFLGLFNIDYDAFRVSNNTLGLQVVAALLVPLLAALIPVLSGAAISVRQAISSYGLGADFGSNVLDRVIEKIGRRFLASYNAMALANTFRRKGRLVLTQLVLVTAGVMFIVVLSLSTSLTATVDTELALWNYDFMVMLEDLQRVDRTSALAKTVVGVDDADMWLLSPVTIFHAGQKTVDAGLGSMLRGVPVDNPLYVPTIVAGRWLQEGDRFAVVMDKNTAEDENIQLGETITLDMGVLGKHDWQVVGFYQVLLMSGGDFSMDLIYAPREAVYEATSKVNKGGVLLVRTQQHDLDSVNAVVSRLQDTFAQHHIEIASNETKEQTRITAMGGYNIMISMMMVLASMVAVVGGIGLMGSLWISVIERTKEVGILRSIGASSLNIMGMFMLEGIIQGLISWLIAVPVALIATPAMASAMGQVIFSSNLYYAFNWSAVILWLVIVLILSIVASAIPARSASQINIRQSLNYDG